jgi:hypothetical protein
MTADKVKVWENRLRRAAKRQKLTLRKSGRRDPNAYDYGLYILVDERGYNQLQSRNLDEVEQYLQQGRAALAQAQRAERNR